MPAFIRSDGIRQDSTGRVDLVPGGAPGLAGAGGREDQEAETEFGGYRGLGGLHNLEGRPRPPGRAGP